MINITGATELLQAQQATFDALDLNIQTLKEQLAQEKALMSTLTDKGLLTPAELKSREGHASEIAILEEAITLAEADREKILKENGPLVAEDVVRIIQDYKVKIRDRHLTNYALIRQKEKEIADIKALISQDEKDESRRVEGFIIQMNQFIPLTNWGDGSPRPRPTHSVPFNYGEIFNQGGNN